MPLRDGALAASAVNRRAWGDGLHHVIDALTGLPTASVVATWALAPDALHADGLATALFFDPAPELVSGTGRVLRQNVRQRARGALALLRRGVVRMTAWLDRVLGRVTMYALVIIALGAARRRRDRRQPARADQLHAARDPGERRGAARRDVRVELAHRPRSSACEPQTSSSFITGAAAALHLRPDPRARRARHPRVAGVVATATKYVLALRGRHIFNPAAAAAFIVGSSRRCSAPPSSRWWVGTAFLLPFARSRRCAILFRTRALARR